MLLSYSIIIILSYLAGSIPFGLLLGRFAGVDIRKAGSGNIGATNAGRLLGRRLGALTLILDIGKGYLPMLALHHWGVPAEIVMAAGLVAFLGHLFPLYLGFRGGKGVATALGVFLFLDWGAILLSLVAFGLMVAVTGFVSAGSLAASLTMVLLLLAFHGFGNYFLLGAVIALLIWWKHRANIERIIRGEEKSWKKKVGR